jgi:predicted transcriptional regulator
MNLLSQTFINEGMRAGIPNPVTREKTITLYIDKAAFRKALDIPSEETIWVLVVDRQGNVLWRTEGVYSQAKEEALLSAILEHSFSLHS